MEDNKFAVTVHYRHIAEDRVAEIEVYIYIYYQNYLLFISDLFLENFEIVTYIYMHVYVTCYVLMQSIVDAEIKKHGLTKKLGKKVWEAGPDFNWHKGTTVQWLVETKFPSVDVVPVYLGDDTADEHVFETFRDYFPQGVGICVAEPPRATAARYTLTDPSQVYQFLQKLYALDTGANVPPQPVTTSSA